MSLPEKGCQKVIIQQSRQPRDHKSVAVEQGRSIQISGLVQKGVPILVLAIPFLLIELTFISPSFMQLSSPIKKLSALTSLWIMFILWRAASPLAISLTKTLISQGQKGRFYFLLRIISCKKSPSSAHYITRQRWFSSTKASLYYMMLGWHILESILISFMQLFLSVRVIQAIFIFFRAYIWWSRSRLTLKTLEKEPEPIWFNIQNAFITEKYIKNKNLIISQPEAYTPEFLPNSSLWPLLLKLEAQGNSRLLKFFGFSGLGSLFEIELSQVDQYKFLLLIERRILLDPGAVKVGCVQFVLSAVLWQLKGMDSVELGGSNINGMANGRCGGGDANSEQFSLGVVGEYEVLPFVFGQFFAKYAHGGVGLHQTKKSKQNLIPLNFLSGIFISSLYFFNSLYFNYKISTTKYYHA